MPQYEGLTIESISKFLHQHPDCFPYFPDKREIRKLPKQWIVNVASSVIGNAFDQWVYEKVKLRNEKVAIEKDLMINVDPEIARAFNSSTAVSCKYFLNYSFWLIVV